MRRLSEQTLGLLPAAVARPGYERSKVRTGIVHLGVGAFHRCHQAVYVDDCLGDQQHDWGIVGGSLRSADTRDALAPQDGLYVLAVRDSDGEALRVIGSIRAVLVAPDGPAALLDAMTDPAVRIVTLTVTEKAYLRGADGGLDRAHPDIVHDLANPANPKTVHGFLAEALARRRTAGTAPFTVLCCDNLPANGKTVRRVLSDYASLRDAELGRFIAQDVAFPSSMVDRIVPATTDADRQRVSQALGVEDAWPVMTEPFSQWVVEDNFPTGRPDWEKFGVAVVEDVTPFEEMKLRLLNGAHSAIAYFGLLLGLPTVDRAFAHPAIRAFVDDLWTQAASTLPAGVGLDPPAYTQQLAARFSNTALAHLTKQIATDGSQKLPQRIVAPALHRLHLGLSADPMALVIAAWIAACQARGEALPAGHFSDPLDAGLASIFASKSSPRETTQAVFALAGLALGDANRAELEQAVATKLTRLREDGAEALLANLRSTNR